MFVSGRSTNAAREQGLWPPKGQTPTMDDVKRLIADGDKIGAIRVYREITGASLKKSKDAVEALGNQP